MSYKKIFGSSFEYIVGESSGFGKSKVEVVCNALHAQDIEALQDLQMNFRIFYISLKCAPGAVLTAVKIAYGPAFLLRLEG